MTIDQTTQWKWFAVLPPGLETSFSHELAAKSIPIKSISIKGGHELNCTLRDGIELIRHLRTPTRWQLQISQFRCSHWDRLKEKLIKIPWNSWINTGPCQWHLTLRPRRANNKIHALIAQAQEISQQQQNLRKGNQQIVHMYLRWIDDVVTISLGVTDRDHYHHFKGKWVGQAPLRDQLAQCLLYQLTPSQSLLDPMCGAGTFLLESTARNKKLPTPLCWGRFPWIGQTLNEKSNVSPAKAASWNNNYGLEKDIKLQEVLKHNGVKDFAITDCFNWSGQAHTLIANPPYGKRLEKKSQIYQLLERLVEQAQLWQVQQMGLIAPRDFAFGPKNSNYTVKTRLAFKNGGLPVELILLEK